MDPSTQEQQPQSLATRLHSGLVLGFETGQLTLIEHLLEEGSEVTNDFQT